jgi:hypothetical protein
MTSIPDDIEKPIGGAKQKVRNSFSFSRKTGVPLAICRWAIAESAILNGQGKTEYAQKGESCLPDPSGRVLRKGEINRLRTLALVFASEIRASAGHPRFIGYAAMNSSLQREVDRPWLVLGHRQPQRSLGPGSVSGGQDEFGRRQRIALFPTRGHIDPDGDRDPVFPGRQPAGVLSVAREDCGDWPAASGEEIQRAAGDGFTPIGEVTVNRDS